MNPKNFDDSQFKIIIAIKCFRDQNQVHSLPIRCIIHIQDKKKVCSLPFNEGQFFDFKDLDITKNIILQFYNEKSNKLIGETTILMPQQILSSHEFELSDQFSFYTKDVKDQQVFKGSYYIIILNKKLFMEKDQQVPQKIEKVNLVKQVQSQKQLDQKNQYKHQPRSFNSKSPAPKKQKLPTKSERSTQKQSEAAKQQYRSSQKQLQERVEVSVQNAMQIEKSKFQKQQQSGSSSKLEQSRVTTLNQSQLNQSGIESENQDQDTQQLHNISELTKSDFIIHKDIIIQKDITGFSERHSHPLEKQEKGLSAITEFSPLRNSSKKSNSPQKQSGHKHAEVFNSQTHQNLVCLNFLDQANLNDQLKIQADYFKKVLNFTESFQQIIYSLTEKIHGLTIESKMVKMLREEQQIQSNDGKNQVDRIEKIKEEFRQLLKESNDTIQKQDNRIKDQEMKILNFEEQEQIFATKIVSLQQKIDYPDQAKELKDAQLRETSEAKRLQLQFDQKIEEQQSINGDQVKKFENSLKEIQMSYVNVENQNQILHTELNKANQNIVQLKQECIDYQRQISDLILLAGQNDKSNAITQNNNIIVQNLQNQINRQKFEIQKSQDDNKLISQQNQMQQQEIKKCQNKQLELERQSLQEAEIQAMNRLELENMNLVLQHKNDLTNDEINKLNSINKNLKKENMMAKNSQELINETKKRNQLLFQTIKELQSKDDNEIRVNNNTKQMLQHKEHELVQIQGELEETQQYAYKLKKLILEMKETGVSYIPFYHDPVDQAMGELINSLNNPERVKDLFVRESEGVYLFGTKKIFAKIEQGRIFIRTGGGYFAIEEFLDLYAAQEIEKSEKHDPKRQWDINQAISAKLDQSRVIRESSHLLSPAKKIKSY